MILLPRQARDKIGKALKKSGVFRIYIGGPYHGTYCARFTRHSALTTSPPQPAGCFDGTNAPPVGTALATGDTLTWTAYGDDRDAFSQASAHEGWQVCFA